MKVVVVTQARSGSTRLPNKVLKKIEGKTLLEIHIERIKKAKLIDEIFIATTTKQVDNKIEELSKKIDVKCYRGDENDVLDRFYQCVKHLEARFIVRLTSDCPLIDPQLVDEVVETAMAKNLDYYANILEERYPDGQDIEVIKFSALENAWSRAVLKSDREHVTPYIRNNSSFKGRTLFTSGSHYNKENFNHVRLTVDEQSDFEVIKHMIESLGFERDWKTYANYYLKNQNLSRLNIGIMRNEGYKKSLSQDK